MSRFIASIVALLLTSLSDAKAWPDQPVKMVVPFAAGGTTDVMARIVADRSPACRRDLGAILRRQSRRREAL